MVTQNVEYLRSHGPATAKELPEGKIRRDDKMAGVWVVNVQVSSGSKIELRGRELTRVYYLRDEHTPIEVISKWKEANKEIIEDSPQTGIRQVIRRAGKEFHDAIDKLIPADGHRIGKHEKEYDPINCPICDEDKHPSELHYHLENEH